MTIVEEIEGLMSKHVTNWMKYLVGKYHHGNAKSKSEMTSSIVIAVCKPYPISGAH